MKRLLIMTLAASLLFSMPAFGQDYATGGPLAGLKLPPNPRYGWGEVQLYPDSVEHYRAYMMKYVPTRSFYDRQSMVRNWAVPNIPGAEGRPVEQFAPPIYQLGRSTTGAPTGTFQPKTPVVRCGVQDPVLSLDMGALKPGLYVVRVIAAVETDALRRFREPLYIGMSVNDGPRGEVNTYRLRCGYVDDFYSIAEIYFHALTEREYSAKVWVDEGSTVELLVHNITLDDCLAGMERRAIKTAVTLHSPEELEALTPPASWVKQVERLKPMSRTTRQERDAAIWRWFPPVNAQGSWMDMNVPTLVRGAEGKPLSEIRAEFGQWEPVQANNHNLGGVLTYDTTRHNAFLVNKKLGLEYTLADLHAGKPLPDPYPYKDDGAGVFFPDPNDPAKGTMIDVIAHPVGMRYRGGCGMALNAAKLWRKTGNENIGRDAAIHLIRFAWQYPTLDAANWFTALAVQPGAYGRDLRCRQREEIQRWMPHYQNYLEPLRAYDLLFDYIAGNEELAQSVGRFVPWVETPQDVVRLLDTYLVQYAAKRIMRYHDHTLPMGIEAAATCLGARAVTDPWMAWLFSRTFVYPLQPAGIQNLMISGCDREGPEYIGSTYYAQGEGASRTALALERYLRAGGNPAFDLSNQRRYPKPLAHLFWQLRITVAGQDFLRIGDVCGPDKAPGATLRNMREACRIGWRWSKDPRFAWPLANLYGRAAESDEELAAVEAAAAKLDRAPWLDLRSRFVANWAGVLEAGLRHDDHRLRRAAYVRTGKGTGHAHSDALDLQVVAHGLPMTIDDGQRSGYSKPNSRFTRVHNTVEVDTGWNLPDELGHGVHGWVTDLSDAEGARYLRARAMVPHTSLYARQVALVDAGEPNSYVVDCFRIDGGSLHTYSFHGPVNDDFTWNVREQKVAHENPTRNADTDAAYLSIFSATPDSKFAGVPPEALVATWRYDRSGGTGSEQRMLGNAFDAAAPRAFTRLYLLETDGLRALRADSRCIKDPINYTFTNVMAQRRGEKLSSRFLAVVEPYRGEPFIKSVTPLQPPGLGRTAASPAGLHVVLQNGRRDMVGFAVTPDKAVTFSGTKPHGLFRMAGAFGYVSRDNGRFRLATLTGGTLLETDGVSLKPAASARTATAAKVDYLKRTITLDRLWPPMPTGRPIEIGQNGRWTSYTPERITVEDGRTVLHMARGADFYRSRITRVAPDTGQVDCALNVPLGSLPGLNKNIAATNEAMTRTWRADMMGGNDFKLTGPPVSEKAFAPEGVLRLWEYGPGDAVRLATVATVRRTDEGYIVTGDVDMTVTLNAKTHKITAARLADGPVRIER